MAIRTALIGLGRTGRTVAESLLEDERFSLAFAVRASVDCEEHDGFVVAPPESLEELLGEHEPEVVIDFSTPAAVMENIARLPDGTGYVIGTTGFADEEVEAIREYSHLRILYAPNISDGINVVMKLCQLLSQLWGGADVELIEEHSTTKIDAPSGTARKLASVFQQEPIIHSVRAGGIVGIHEVIAATDTQKITIMHESFNRQVFAEGAKRGAIWLMDRRRGFYEVQEVYV